MTRHVLFSLVALLTAAGCATKTPPMLRGRVVDEAGQPVARARVAAYTRSDGTDTDRELSIITTRKDGQFMLRSGQRAEMVTVIASIPGRCIDWAYAVPPTDEEVVVLRLGPPATIEGSVVDEAGKPLAGVAVDATLEIERPEHRVMPFTLPGRILTTATDAAGRFRFDAVPPSAKVGLRLSAPGRAGAAIRPLFHPGQPGLRFVLPPEGRIEGVAVDESTGAPLPGIRLYAANTRGSEYQYASATTDEQGRFRMDGLGGGNYVIGIDDSGPAATGWIGVQRDVVVETGKRTSMKLMASKGGILELSWIDRATGKAVPEVAQFAICPAEDLSERIRARASVDGVARLCLPPGEYVVGEMLSPNLVFREEDRTRFQVKAGETMRVPVQVKVIPPLSVLVCDSAGQPVPGAAVRVMTLDGRCMEMTTDKEGRFAMRLGPVGNLVVARHPQQELMGANAFGKEHADKPQELRVVLGEPEWISGMVLDPKGQPAGGAQVEIDADASHFGSFGVVASTHAGADGRYRVAVPRYLGAYAATATAPGASSARELLLHVTTKDLKLRAGRTLNARVLGPDAKPVPGAVVSARAGGHEFPDSAVTDERGRFTLPLNDAPTIYLFVHVPARGWTGDRTLEPGQDGFGILVAPASAFTVRPEP